MLRAWGKRALLLFVSFDVRRYLPLVKCLAVLSVAFGTFMLVLDIAVDMPLFWILSEGPFVIVLGGVFLWLAARSGRGVDSAG